MAVAEHEFERVLPHGVDARDTHVPLAVLQLHLVRAVPLDFG